MKAEKREFLKSLAGELRSQSLRVRQLIGGSHWGHDGRHKEILLQNLIRRHCPSTILVTTGFIISPNESEVRSREQDILLIDIATEAPLFHQGDLAIAFPKQVIAAISVKSNMTDASIQDVVVGLKSVHETAQGSGIEPSDIWCAGVFFQVDEEWEGNEERIYKSIRKNVTANPVVYKAMGGGNKKVLGPDLLADINRYAFLIDYDAGGDIAKGKIRGYECGDAATAVFISCLVEHIAFRLRKEHSAFEDYIGDLPFESLNPQSMTLG